ncbi:MAG: hypothetical protein LBC33_02775 [Mycoplasmataceae bacterium]|nr:hypothetical protein [Mycoplasmataceae bacterium]
MARIKKSIKHQIINHSHVLINNIVGYKSLKTLNSFININDEQLVLLRILKLATVFFKLIYQLEKKEITAYYDNFINFHKKQLKDINIIIINKKPILKGNDK